MSSARNHRNSGAGEQPSSPALAALVRALAHQAACEYFNEHTSQAPLDTETQRESNEDTPTPGDL